MLLEMHVLFMEKFKVSWTMTMRDQKMCLGRVNDSPNDFHAVDDRSVCLVSSHPGRYCDHLQYRGFCRFVVEPASVPRIDLKKETIQMVISRLFVVSS